jgi:HSP20 family protein
MAIKELVPWKWGGLRRWETEDRPIAGFRREMESIHRAMERLFEDLWSGHFESARLPELWSGGDVVPRIDETEDEKAFHVAVELPGMSEKDVEVTLANGLLTIRGEKKREEEQKGKDLYRQERSFGAFRRTLALPEEVDESQIEASFKNGVLTIDLPKTKEAREKVKHISVKAA